MGVDEPGRTVSPVRSTTGCRPQASSGPSTASILASRTGGRGRASPRRLDVEQASRPGPRGSGVSAKGAGLVITSIVAARDGPGRRRRVRCADEPARTRPTDLLHRQPRGRPPPRQDPSRCSSGSRSTSRSPSRRRSPARWSCSAGSGRWMRRASRRWTRRRSTPSSARRRRSTASRATWPRGPGPVRRHRDDYGGDAARVWTEAADGRDLDARLFALPGFGEMKAGYAHRAAGKRFGVRPAGWEALAPDHPTLGDVDSAEALADYQAGKRARKAVLRAQGKGADRHGRARRGGPDRGPADGVAPALQIRRMLHTRPAGTFDRLSDPASSGSSCGSPRRALWNLPMMISNTASLRSC